MLYDIEFLYYNIKIYLYPQHADAKLFKEKDEPTEEHLEMLLWAYSPEAAKVKKVIKETHEEKQDGGDKRDSRKRKSSGNENESPSKKQKED